MPYNQLTSAAGRPKADGPVVECGYCFMPAPASNVYKNIRELENDLKERKRKSKVEDFDVSKCGRLAPVAAKILMKILHGARAARMDLLRIIGH